MALTAVTITDDVYFTCLAHALSTENEEVMGLLLGDIEKQENHALVANVCGLVVLARSDKRPDRVEISPEQLADAAAQAEKIAQKLNKVVRVIGWYHSHPHITVHPSHVDVHTQSMYQTMDSGFVGLIFSCFHSNSSNKGHVQVIAFQSVDTNSLDEEPVAPQDIVDTRKHATVIPVAPLARLHVTLEVNKRRSSATGNANASTMSPEYTQCNIPLYILPSLATSPNVITKLVHVQRLLLEEERASYLAAAFSSEGDIHPLQHLHSTAVYQKALCRLIEYQCAPLLNMLQDKKEANDRLLVSLRNELKSLQ